MNNEKLVKESIARDLADHVVTLRFQQGLYQHWRCQKPGSWNMGFDIVTWPGSLCYTGDMGDFLFQRTEDMVSFMRTACRDYSYAAQKCVARGSEINEWDDEQYKQVLKDRAEEGETFRVWVRSGPEGSHRQRCDCQDRSRIRELRLSSRRL